VIQTSQDWYKDVGEQNFAAYVLYSLQLEENVFLQIYLLTL